MANKKRSTASYRAAAKKAAATRKRNSRVKTQRTRSSAKPTKRRKRTSKKSGLSEMFNPKMAAAGAKQVGLGLLGGASYKIIEKVFASKSEEIQMIAGGAVAFATAVWFKAPAIASGLSGALAYKGMEWSGLLAEDSPVYLQDHAYANEIDRLPAILNEDGMYLEEESLYLEENGMYLEDEDLNADNYNVGYYGAGFGSGQGMYE